MAKKKGLTTQQRKDLLGTVKSVSNSIIEVMKTGPVPRYAIASLALLALGKAKVVSCGVVGTLQGVNTYLAISEVVEEDVDSGFFGIGGVGETIAKGGTSILIGSLWGLECEAGNTRYSEALSGRPRGEVHVSDVMAKAKPGYDIWDFLSLI